MKLPIKLEQQTIDWSKSFSQDQKMKKLYEELIKLLGRKSQKDYPASYYLASMIETRKEE